MTLFAHFESETALYFRNELRDARARVLDDGEAFEAILLVLERMGRMCDPAGRGLADYQKALALLANRSPLAADLPNSFPQFHLPFETLFQLVREGRNAAVHEGALARHVTVHAVELALILEDALMPRGGTIAEVMVRNPTIAAPWHPLSFIRQSMLASSFSYLPVRLSDDPKEPWRLVSDFAVARYLRDGADSNDWKHRLQTPLRDAVSSGFLQLDTGRCVQSSCEIKVVLSELTVTPVLVHGQDERDLIGIVTAFDLL